MGDMANSLGSGETSVLGGERAIVTPQTNSTASPSTNVDVSGGNAVSAATGFTFPGVGNVEEGTSPYFSSAFNKSVTTPPNVTSDTVEVVGNVTHLATTGQAVITTRISYDGTEYSQSTSIPANVGNQQMTLFSGRVTGADVPNTTLDLELSRVAGSGDDTSSYNSVSLDNIGLKQTQTSFNTSSPSNQLSGV